MIIVMVLGYVALLFVLVKVGVIKLNTFWKISPLIWGVICFIVFFLPMQWGAPQGAVRYTQQVLRIIPNVSGEVIEVHVDSWQKVEVGDPLFTIDPEPFQATVDSLTAQLKLAELRLEQSTKLFDRGAGPEYEVQQYASQVASLQGQIISAQWNLDSTVVRAQADGVVMGVTVSPGQRATNTGGQIYLTLVESRGAWIVGLNQNVLRHVFAGQPVEVALKSQPGQIHPGHVSAISATSPQGAISSGAIVTPPDGTTKPYALMIELEDDPAPHREDNFGGGITGVAAIYTDAAKPTHVIRKIMIRMQTWKDYVLPG